MEETENEGGEGGAGLYEREWRVYARIAEAVNRLNPKLAARPGEDSPGIFNVRVRVAPRLAAYFGQDVIWSGAVAVALDEFGYEWENREEKGDIFSLDGAPSLDFDGTAATNPVYEQEEVTPVAVSNESLRQVAEAIVEAARRLLKEAAQPEGFCGYEFLQLWRDVENPKADRRRSNDWRAREQFKQGERYMLILRSGEIPALYPAGDFAHQGALPSTALFAALLPSLATSWPKLREIVAVEGGDAGEVLEALVASRAVEYDGVLRTLRELRARARTARPSQP